VQQQDEYVGSFHGAVLDYLSFDPRYADLAERLAAAVTGHATPVGSGTVARTERIPLEGRAEAAVIAWMRHRTTAYDRKAIPRVKGRRREVRRLFAQRSKLLLDAYRAGREGDALACPMQGALSGGAALAEETPACGNVSDCGTSPPRRRPSPRAELPRVAVRGAQHHEHQLPGRDHPAVRLDVAPRRADGHLERRAVAQHLLDRRGQQVGRRHEAGELIRVLDEARQRIVDQVGGRLGAGHEQELEEAQDLPVLEPPAAARSSP
jgi:hypothetical protein